MTDSAMRINIVTLFPEFFAGPLSCGLMQRAREAGIVTFVLCNPRDMALDRHRTVDDRPYGGGPGMVMRPAPLAAALRRLGYEPGRAARPGPLLLLSPAGLPFDQAMARRLAGASDAPGLEHTPPTAGGVVPEKVLTIICGRYEGIDGRIETLFHAQPVSVGDFVLNGGEAGAMCVVESVTRLLPGFMGHESSGEDESFSRGLLEYPHYTRPESFAGERTPPALLSGDHGRIALWRRQAALKRTLDRRPELLSTAPLDQDDRAFLRAARRRGLGRNLFCALLHYPVLDRDQNSVAVSLTNLDIHDIARSSCTYGLAGYYVLTPLDDQRELLADIVDHWLRGPGGKANPDRKTALSLVRGGTGLDDAVADVKARTGEGPLLVGTSAVAPGKGTPVQDFGAVSSALDERPVLLLFGTGNGLAPEVVERCDAMLPPLRPLAGYNHLSVRSAAAIVFDRILNDWR